MLKLNSNTFYTRHQNELNRYIFNKADTLHIIADDVEIDELVGSNPTHIALHCTKLIILSANIKIECLPPWTKN